MAASSGSNIFPQNKPDPNTVHLGTFGKLSHVDVCKGGEGDGEFDGRGYLLGRRRGGREARAVSCGCWRRLGGWLAFP